MQNKKNELRQLVIELRNSINETEKEALDNKIFENVVQLKEYISAKVIFIYVSYKSEVDTHRIIKKALSEGKVVCVPKIISRKEGMKALKIDNFQDLKVGCYGILEPDNKNIEINSSEGAFLWIFIMSKQPLV